jgi:hypothetical protein
MKLLMSSGERVELSSPSDWLTARNRRLQDLEFFNRIDQKRNLMGLAFPNGVGFTLSLYSDNPHNFLGCLNCGKVSLRKKPVMSLK